MDGQQREQRLKEVLNSSGPNLEHDINEWVYRGHFPHDNRFLVAIIENNLYNALKSGHVIYSLDWITLIDAMPPKSHGTLDKVLWKGLNNGSSWRKD